LKDKDMANASAIMEGH